MQTWLFKSNHQIKLDMECHILISATSVSEKQRVQVIVSTKYFAFASHDSTASNTESGDRAAFLQNIAAEALATKTDDSPLTLIEKV